MTSKNLTKHSTCRNPQEAWDELACTWYKSASMMFKEFSTLLAFDVIYQTYPNIALQHAFQNTYFVSGRSSAIQLNYCKHMRGASPKKQTGNIWQHLATQADSSSGHDFTRSGPPPVQLSVLSALCHWATSPTSMRNSLDAWQTMVHHMYTTSITHSCKKDKWI